MPNIFRRPARPTGPAATARPVRAQRRARRLRITGIVALAAVGAMLRSTGTNLARESAERASVTRYGERVHVHGGSLNVYRTGPVGPTIVMLSGLGTEAPALGGHGPYVLMGHSLSGLHTLACANRYPQEVSAVIGIDQTVPAGKRGVPSAAASTGSEGGIPWSRIPSVTGLVRWADSIAPSLAEPAGDAFTASERERIRLMSSCNFANPAQTDEVMEMGDNARKLQDAHYPDGLPVLDFLAQDTIDADATWRQSHETQLQNVANHKIIVLNGGHYLHWTQSTVMAKAITDFLAPGQ